MPDCLRSRSRKDPVGAIRQASSAHSLARVNKAIATCGYSDEESLKPSEALLTCMAERVEILLGSESKGLDYDEVLQDVDLILAGLEDNSSVNQKLRIRQLHVKAICLNKLGRCAEAMNALEVAAEENDLRGEGISRFMFKTAMDKLRKTIADRMARPEPEEQTLPFPRCPLSGSYPFSNSVRVEVGADGSKRVVAARDVRVAEVLAVERALSSSLHCSTESLLLTHCSRCLKHTRTPLPCPNCCDAVFCSVGCVKAAVARSHGSFECRVGLQSLLREWTKDPAYSLSLPAVRASLESQRLNSCTGPPTSPKRTTSDAISDESEEYLSAYFNVLAVSWMRILRQSGDLPDEVPLFSALQENLKVVWSPATKSVYDSVDKCLEPGSDLELEPVGRAFYPGVSVIRHGCAQNVVFVFSGDTLLAAATRNIAKGEEVVFNRLHNLNMRRECRKRILR